MATLPIWFICSEETHHIEYDLVSNPTMKPQDTNDKEDSIVQGSIGFVDNTRQPQIWASKEHLFQTSHKTMTNALYSSLGSNNDEEQSGDQLRELLLLTNLINWSPLAWRVCILELFGGIFLGFVAVFQVCIKVYNTCT